MCCLQKLRDPEHESQDAGELGPEFSESRLWEPKHAASASGGVAYCHAKGRAMRAVVNIPERRVCVRATVITMNSSAMYASFLRGSVPILQQGADYGSRIVVAGSCLGSSPESCPGCPIL